MFADRTVKDLFVLTIVKAAAIMLIYYACFAAYDGRPVDTISHLLGPSSPGPSSPGPSSPGPSSPGPSSPGPSSPGPSSPGPSRLLPQFNAQAKQGN